MGSALITDYLRQSLSLSGLLYGVRRLDAVLDYVSSGIAKTSVPPKGGKP
jgi:hypothetical protein